MGSPENDRGPGLGSRASAESAATTHTDEAHRTPALGRLTWNGHPGLLPTFARRRGWFDPELERLLRDPEAAALSIFDVVGPRRAAAIGARLVELSRELAR